MHRRPSVACAALVVLLAALIAAAFVAPAGAGATRVGAPQSPPPQAFILVDAQSGAILAAGHEHNALPPASVAKIMTAVTAVERLPANALITVSPLAAGQPASRINMAAGQKWTFDSAIASLMMVSANDAAYAVGEQAGGGTVPGFVAAAQRTAHRLGMRDSTFADPAGLDDKTSYQGGPRMSAYDIAIATRNALAVPELAKYAAMRKYNFVDPTGLRRYLINHNKFIPGSTFGYAGATGFKTGYTERAGHTIAASATRNGRTLIAVVINTYDIYGWAAQLLDQGFAAHAPVNARRLPPVAVSPYDSRVSTRNAFAAFVSGNGTIPASPAAVGTDASATTTTRSTSTTSSSTTTSSTSSTTSTTVKSSTTKPTTASSVVAGDQISAQQAAGASGVSDWLSVRNFAIVAILLVAAFVLLRRRAVRRHRARRIALQRTRAAKMRSGALTVVDGRFRAGNRSGPPVESHVRIRPEPANGDEPMPTTGPANADVPPGTGTAERREPPESTADS
jgi:D-alanyl-D-alanine carboxypeptidase